MRGAASMSGAGIHYMDVGTSGGVAGLDRGFCVMIGGEADTFKHLEPVFAALAPGADMVPPTKGRSTPSSADSGYLHCGPHGAGHFVKMIHNRSEEHTSELQSLMRISYAVFCLNKKKKKKISSPKVNTTRKKEK